MDQYGVNTCDCECPDAPVTRYVEKKYKPEEKPCISSLVEKAISVGKFNDQCPSDMPRRRGLGIPKIGWESDSDYDDYTISDAVWKKARAYEDTEFDQLIFHSSVVFQKSLHSYYYMFRDCPEDAKMVAEFERKMTRKISKAPKRQLVPDDEPDDDEDSEDEIPLIQLRSRRRRRRQSNTFD